MNWFQKLFKKKIIIPLVRKGIPTGQWVECYKNDHIYLQLTAVYGKPLPKQIEVEPLTKNNIYDKK
jgi:hypothetical protein